MSMYVMEMTQGPCIALEWRTVDMFDGSGGTQRAFGGKIQPMGDAESSQCSHDRLVFHLDKYGCMQAGWLSGELKTG